MRVLVAGFLAMMAAPASADWGHMEQGGAFDDNPMHIAVGESGPYGFGFRCQQGEETEAVFITPEQVEPDTAELMRAFPMVLLVRVDDNEPHEIAASADFIDGALSLYAEVPEALLGEVEAASRRVAVAMQSLGETYHETEFNVRGSTAAVVALKEGCALASAE